MALQTPSKVFNSKKIYKTKKGYMVKYIAGQRYIYDPKTNKWRLSYFQDRNRNLAERQDRGL